MKFTKLAAAALCGALLLTGCGKDTLPEKPVMSVGDIEASNGVFYLFASSYYKQTKDEDAAREGGIEEAESGYLRVAIAKAMGIELSDEDKAAMESQKAQIKASYDDTYESFLAENHLTEEDVETIVSFGYYSDALRDTLGTTEYTDEQKREYFKNHYRRAKHVLVMIDDDTDDAAAKAKAEEILAKAQAGEDFDALIAEYGEDPGMTANPEGYVFTDNTMVREFQDGVDSLNVGEFTIAKTSYGYHVITRLDLEETPEYFEKVYANEADTLDETIKDGIFEDQLVKWAEEYNIETKLNDDVIDKILKIIMK